MTDATIEKIAGELDRWVESLDSDWMRIDVGAEARRIRDLLAPEFREVFAAGCDFGYSNKDTPARVEALRQWPDRRE